MKQSNTIIAIFFSILSLLPLTSCGKKEEKENILNYSALEPYIMNVSEATLPTNGIIALGEATHGNKEFTLLKLQVFQQLVKNSDIRAFALEGDFGGCQKVNQYIHTGEGSSSEAASEIGFAIYRTEEMVQILNWMREFNLDKEENEQIRFYGYDMQRYDNNKKELTTILKQSFPELAQKYEDTLIEFTDDSMFDLEPLLVEETITKIETLNSELDVQKPQIIELLGEQTYELATAYADSILENTILRTEQNYGTVRDQYMASRVQWIKNYEKNYYGKDGIFITGHNGHVGKVTATVGTEKIMGQILSEQYGDAYYVIGTEFGSSTFLAPDDNGERKEFLVKNQGNNRLSVILTSSPENILFLDIDQVVQDSALQQYLATNQPISLIGEYFSETYAKNEKFYTQNLPPSKSYDALIYVKSATPSTML